MSHRRRVILESPFASDTAEGVSANIDYARKALLDSLTRGEAPIASHLLHTQVVDDRDPAQRDMGIEAGLAWAEVAQGSVVYADRGISSGMEIGIKRARSHGLPIEYRYIETTGDTP